MPVTWNDQNRNLLLLKVLEQHPSVLSRVDSEAIASSWPGSQVASKRGISDQIDKIRRQIKNKDFTASTNPRPSSTPRTPKTPAKPNTTIPATTPPSKRKNSTTNHSSKETPSKRRKLSKKISDTESEAPELTSSADETGDNEETEDEKASLASTTTTKRKLPDRSRSRSKSYAIDADSAGEDAGAKDLLSDEDAEFSIEIELKGKKTGKKNVTSTSDKERNSKGKGALLDDDSDGEGLRDEDCKEASDEASRTTAGMSHQTYVSALDDW